MKEPEKLFARYIGAFVLHLQKLRPSAMARVLGDEHGAPCVRIEASEVICGRCYATGHMQHMLDVSALRFEPEDLAYNRASQAAKDFDLVERTAAA